jgi:hypothetical protein
VPKKPERPRDEWDDPEEDKNVPYDPTEGGLFIPDEEDMEYQGGKSFRIDDDDEDDDFYDRTRKGKSGVMKEI